MADIKLDCSTPLNRQERVQILFSCFVYTHWLPEIREVQNEG